MGQRLAPCARLEDLHLHDLQGEAGSQLLEAGVPIHGSGTRSGIRAQR